MSIADTNANIFELTEKPSLQYDCHWAFPIRLVGSAEELSSSLGFSAKSSSCIVIYKCNIHVPALPGKENMCLVPEWHICLLWTKICFQRLHCFILWTFPFLIPYFGLIQVFHLTHQKLLGPPNFFLQGVSVHRKVGQKPDISRIFIKCNNWTLC